MTEPRPPAQIAPYVEVLGPALAQDFFLRFGGAELYLAQSPKGRSALVELVGHDRAQALAARHLPRRVPLAKGWIAQRMARVEGLPVAEIARRLHVSDVTVRRYLDEDAPRREAPRQLRLF